MSIVDAGKGVHADSTNELVFFQVLHHHIILDEIVGLEGNLRPLRLQHFAFALDMLRSLMSPPNQKPGQTNRLMGNATTEECVSKVEFQEVNAEEHTSRMKARE